MRTTEITAQLESGDEAYVAFSRYRHDVRETGDRHAEIWRTTDRGRTWHPLSWRRAARVFVSGAAFAEWPPEWVNKMWLCNGRLEIEFAEDWGTDAALEPIWHTTWDGARWRLRLDRRYRFEVDGAFRSAAVEFNLPGITAPPRSGPFR